MAWLSWLLQLTSVLGEMFSNLWDILFGNEVSLGMGGESVVPREGTATACCTPWAGRLLAAAPRSEAGPAVTQGRGAASSLSL